jgi:hypothetical protein
MRGADRYLSYDGVAVCYNPISGMKALNGSDVAETWIACEQWTGVGRTAAALSESNDDVMHIDDSVSEGSITDNKHVRRSEERSE